MRVVREPQFAERVFRLIEARGQPVSVEFVSHNLGICWVTAKTLLLSLAQEGQLEAVRTTMGYVFYLPDQKFFTYKKEKLKG
mgnify:FL=1